MKNLSIRRTGLVALAGSAVVLAGCGNGAGETSSGGDDRDAQTADSTEGSGGETTTLTVGLIPIVDVAPMYLGVREGFFEEEGLTIEPVMAAGGAAIVPAVTSGSYQIGFSNNVSLMVATARGLPLSLVAPGVGISPDNRSSEDSAGYCSVMANGTGPIQDPADLEGRTVAVNTLNNIGDVTISAALEKDGVSSDSVSFVEMPFPDMPAALDGERVDAVWACEPFVTILLDQGAVAVLDNYGKTDPNLPVASYFAADDWIEKNPDLLAGFTNAVTRSMQYAEDNPEEVREILSEYTQIDDETAAQIGLPNFPTDFNRDGLEVLIRLSDEAGLLEEPLTVDDILSEN